jgi:hypothetical protein
VVASLVVVQEDLEQEQVKVLLLELNTQLPLALVALDRLLLVALGEPMEIPPQLLAVLLLPRLLLRELYLLAVAAVVRPALI